MTPEQITELFSHPTLPRTTLSAWRPAYRERAKLIKVATGFPDPQAAVGDVVEVVRTITPPTGYYNDEPGCIWIAHWDGSNMQTGVALRGTAGVWEKVEVMR